MRGHRSIGVLTNSVDILKQPGFVEMIRGVLTAISPLRSSLLLIDTSPMEWQSEMAGSLAGIIVVQQNVTAEELAIFQRCNLPFLRIPDSYLTIKDCEFFEIGQRVAKALNHAALTGEPAGEIKVSEIDSELKPCG